MLIEIAGQEKRLKYDFNAIADIEEKANMSIGEMFTDEKAGFHTIRLLLWGGLKHEDRGITVQRVGLLIQNHIEEGGTLAELLEPIGKALNNSGIVGKQRTE
jgi:hypothetical protein